MKLLEAFSCPLNKFSLERTVTFSYYLIFFFFLWICSLGRVSGNL